MNKAKRSKKISKPQPAAPPRRRQAVFCFLALFLPPLLGGAAQAHDFFPQYLGANRASVDPLHPCLRAGRCDADSYGDRVRLQRMDRLAPQAPQTPVYEGAQPRPLLELSPVDQLVPAYRETGTIRDEWGSSGSRR
jgi:hypothetical protein